MNTFKKGTIRLLPEKVNRPDQFKVDQNTRIFELRLIEEKSFLEIARIISEEFDIISPQRVAEIFKDHRDCFVIDEEVQHAN